MHIALGIGGIVLLAVVLARAGAIITERRSMRERPLGPNGVISGAEPIRAAGGSAAVLLLHGAGDTPQSLTYLAEHLVRQGYAVSAPLLPGHGTTLRALSRSTADSWLDAAESAYAELRSDREWVSIVAQSMGGALAVQLAAEHPELPALVLISPYLRIPPSLGWAARLAPILALVMPYPRSADDRSIQDTAERARALGFGLFPVRTLRSLKSAAARGSAALPRVRAPTLVIQSREDNRVAVADAQRAYERLGSREKRLAWVAGAGHVLTVDFGREHVFALLSEWLDAHGAIAARARGGGTSPSPCRPDSLPPP